MDSIYSFENRDQFQVLEGLRVDLWRSGDSIAWTSRTFIYFVLACYVEFCAYIVVRFDLELFYFVGSLCPI